MKNPFKRHGFDGLIPKGTSIDGGVNIGLNQTLVVDGEIFDAARVVGPDAIDNGKKDSTTLVVGGTVQAVRVEVANVVVTGILVCETLHVEGQLSVCNGGSVTATNIKYRSLVVEPNAIISGNMRHLDQTQVPQQQEEARTNHVE